MIQSVSASVPGEIRQIEARRARRDQAEAAFEQSARVPSRVRSRQIQSFEWVGP